MIRPLQQLLETFQGPTRLITKRQDKHIDFSASAQRAEKNRDPNKDKMVCICLKKNFNHVILGTPASRIPRRFECLAQL